MVIEVDKTPVDHGYSWVILAACFGMYTMLAGSVKSSGILYAELLDYYGESAGDTAWVTSVCFSLQMILGPFSNYLAEIFSFKIVTFIGGFLISLGYLLSSFVPEMKLLYITLGIVSGIGYGCIFSPCSTLLVFFFEKRRALANGIMVSGSGIGNALFPYLYRYLIDEYGLKGAFILICGILLHICVFASLCRQPSILQKKETERKLQNQSRSRNNVGRCHNLKCFSSIFDTTLLKSSSYLLLALAFSINVCAYIVNITILPAQVEAQGYGKYNAAIIVSIIGATSIFARLFFGWFADLRIIQPKHIVAFSCIIGGIIATLMPLLHSFPALIFYASTVGIFPGAFWSLTTVILIDSFGIMKLRQAFGFVSFCMGTSFIVGPPIAGWLEDLTGTWDHSFQFAGVASLTAGLLLLIESKCSSLCKEDRTASHTVNGTALNTKREYDADASTCEYKGEQSLSALRKAHTGDVCDSNEEQLQPLTRGEG